MSYRFFDEKTAGKYSFFRIPKFLVFDKKFKKGLSPSAKILYGLMLDRVSLSLSNKWLDRVGHVYIIYTREEIMRDINCSENTAARVLRELQDAQLILRKPMGFGRPQRIYVMEYIPENDSEDNCKNDASRDIEDETSRDTNNETSRDTKNDTSENAEVSKPIPLEAPEPIPLEAPKMHTIKTDMYNTKEKETDFSFTPFYSPTGENPSEAPKEGTGEQCKANKARVTASTKGRRNTETTLELFHKFMDSGEEALFECNPGTKLYDALEEYFAYRDETKHKLIYSSVRKTVLSADSYATKYGPEKVCSVIDKSISNGYTGVFFETLDKQAKSGPRKQTEKEQWNEFNSKQADFDIYS